MRKVTAGEPMLPHFTAPWFNQTINLDKKFGTGDQAKIITKHQNIIDCVNDSSVAIDYLKPVKIFNRIKPQSNNTTTSYCSSISGPEDPLAITQQKIAPGATGKVCVFGLTLAYIDDYNTFIGLEGIAKPYKVRRGIGVDLKLDIYGPGQLIYYNPDGPSLITIGNHEKESGIAYLEEGASARNYRNVGIGYGRKIAIDPLDRLNRLDGFIKLCNLSTKPILPGYVQYKQVGSHYVIDVAPCYEEPPVHL